MKSSQGLLGSDGLVRYPGLSAAAAPARLRGAQSAAI